jgi:hypothetical protein
MKVLFAKVDDKFQEKFKQALEIVYQKSGVRVNQSHIIRAEVNKWINRQLNK